MDCLPLPPPEGDTFPFPEEEKIVQGSRFKVLCSTGEDCSRFKVLGSTLLGDVVVVIGVSFEQV